MSLWEKWEKEEKRKRGIRVDPDIKVHDEYKKPNLQKQLAIVAAVILGCLLFLFAFVVVESAYTGRRWSDSAVIRLLMNRQRQREAMSRN